MWENKVYDGNKTATLNFSNVIVDGLIDDLAVSATGEFESKDAGTNLLVTINDLVLVGSKKDNYELVSCQGTTSANITRKEIKVSGIKAVNKEFDETTAATLDYSEVVFDGIVSGDNLTVTATGTFIDANYGTNKTVSITNIVLDGESINNYYLATSGNQETTVASITKLIMTAIVNGYNGTYDKASHTITIKDTIDGVTITYSTSEDGEYSNEVISYTNAGTYTIYYYETISGSETITINKKEVTVSNIKANDKVYDGTTNVTLDLTNAIIDGIIDNEITINATGSFEDKNVGSNKNVNIILSLSDQTNYILSSANQTSAAASITSKKITITDIKVLDKAYDKTTDATIDNDTVVIEGLVDGDKVTIIAKAKFVDEATGKDKKGIISDFELDGLDKGNYQIELNQFETSANITSAKSKGLGAGAIVAIALAAIVVFAGASVGAVIIFKKKYMKA